MITLKKIKPFSNDIVLVDGLWGTGKSIIAPIVGAMDGLEKQKIEAMFEHLCILSYLKKIDDDAVDALLNIYADKSQYYNLIGREVNLRWNDDTGPKNNPNSFRYFKRLFRKDGDSIVDEINQKNLALHLMTHMVLPVSEPLIKGFGGRLKIIEIVRHPVYMVQHWYSYLSNFDHHREFSISFEYNGQKVPWFASSWKDKYVGMTVMDRALSSIIFMYSMLLESLDSLNLDNQKIFVTSFESFVMNTKDELVKLESFLGRSHDKNIKKILKQQKIPREQLLQGKGHAGYGWTETKADSEKDAYNNELKLIQTKASDAVLSEFNNLIQNYNKRWPSILSKYHES